MIDEVIHLSDDAEPADTSVAVSPPAWPVLVVDDDPEVHSVTRFVLTNLRLFGRPLRLGHAYNAGQARDYLRRHRDIAVALLDVVMETEQAGLDLVKYIREELGLRECRLILRTGQPGYAPELSVIQNYDINDYRTKAELTHARLISTLSTALRAYEQLRTMAEQRRGLEQIVQATADLLERRSLTALAEGVLHQLAVRLKRPLDGLLCVRQGTVLPGDYLVGASGRFARYLGQPLKLLPEAGVVAAIEAGFTRHQHQFGLDHSLLYLKGAQSRDAVVFLDVGLSSLALDPSLLEIFSANVTACLRNLYLVESLLAARQEIERQRRFLRTVIDADPHFIYVKDRQGRITLVNQSLAATFGLTPEQMLGRTLAESIADPERLPLSLDDDSAILTQARSRIEQETRFLDQQGETRWLHTIKAPIKNEAGEVEQLIGVGIDTTERKRAEQSLFEAKERALVTLHSIGDAVITTDDRAMVEYLNPVAERLTGWSTAEARGQPLGQVFPILDEETRQPVANPVERCLQEGRVLRLADRTLLIGREQGPYHVEVTAAPIRDRDGRRLGAVLVFHDVTETRKLTRQLEYDATHDALTGLINRAEFERRLERVLLNARQYHGRHTLCYLDLDQFKVVNDSAGHTAGDELLKQINNLLSGLFRERDTLARIGGDEFGLLLENCPMDRARLIAQTLVNTIRDYRFSWKGRTYQIGVSIGLVAITAEAKDTTQLLTQADIACYLAKEMGRGRVHVYQPEDTETSQRHSEILGAAGLRDALEEGRFRLHYQPIVALDSPGSRPVRYEALLRFAQKGCVEEADELVLPSAIIPAAERYGLMGAIDRWVIQTAFRDYVAGIGRTGAKLAINLSGNSLNDDTLFDFIETQFAEQGFPPERLCFEISETAAIQNLRGAVELMVALKSRGCQFALDDFGSGLSALQYLKILPVDYLKIDGSFVKDMVEDDGDAALVAAINNMSHSLGIQTIGEYAHSEAIIERLRHLGVDYAQGYYFGRPSPWDPLPSPHDVSASEPSGAGAGPPIAAQTRTPRGST